MKGLLLVVDGIDGAGKSGTVTRISHWFEQAQVPHIVTREPGGTDLAEFIRLGLRHGFEGIHEDVDPVAAMLLFNAARAQHVALKIRPALQEGKVVICDRFFDTTLAYQGAGMGVDKDTLRGIHELAIGMYPDMTLLMDGPPEVFLQRMQAEDRDEVNKYDKLGLPFYERAREAYLIEAKTKPEAYVVVDANQPRDQVFAQMLPTLMKIKNLMIPRPTT
jgi:dTMP kinase